MRQNTFHGLREECSEIKSGKKYKENFFCQFTVRLFLLRFNYIIQEKSGSIRIIFYGYFKIYTFVFKEFNKITVLSKCAIGI